MRLLKDRVWKELHERVVNDDLFVFSLWTSRDSEIFNSYPFKLLCERFEDLEDKLLYAAIAGEVVRKYLINEVESGKNP